MCLCQGKGRKSLSVGEFLVVHTQILIFRLTSLRKRSFHQMEAETTGEVVDKPMEERQRKILRSARADLIEDMNVREVLRHMTTVFTEDEEDKIKSPGNTRRVQCETFLDILPSRGAKAYDIFREALRKVNSSLVKVLNQAGT